MDSLKQKFHVSFEYNVYFDSHIFNLSNTLFSNFLQEQSTPGTTRKLLFVIDKEVLNHHPELEQQIKDYFAKNQLVQLIDSIQVIPGGELAKNDEKYFHQILDTVNHFGIDRHSYIAAIGGGSVLDLVGYAAAVSHRGIKLIRIPTTVLSQNDSGVGVKNSINHFGKKNFLGTFAPPAAVINDYHFLTTLSDRDWRSGISEAVKVALIKDAEFFCWLEANAGLLVERDETAMKYLIKRCAELHLEHIGGGDPFEMGSSRPLDFGHWTAHKLEQLTNFQVLHGEAVAMGLAQDTVYSFLSGRLAEKDMERIVTLLIKFGFDITHPFMEINDKNSPVLKGLEEFREHLGGKLTIMLLKSIGKGDEVHEMDTALLIQSAQLLKNYNKAFANS